MPISQAIALLNEKNATLAAVTEKGAFFSEDRGLKPLLCELQKDKDFFRGAAVADKVIGKAAALLMVYGGVAVVHTEIISSPAAAVFVRASLPFQAEKTVERIENRTGTGLCPMESLCMDIDDPKRAFTILSQAVKNMS